MTKLESHFKVGCPCETGDIKSHIKIRLLEHMDIIMALVAGVLSMENEKAKRTNEYAAWAPCTILTSP